MAYMMADGSGPYSNKRGEFRGNVVKYAHVGRDDPDEVDARHRFLSGYYSGRPRPEGKATTAELEAHGIAGYYLVADVPMPAGATEFPTPPELTEPEAAPPPASFDG